MFLALGGTLGLSLVILGLRLGAFQVHFGVFVRLSCQTLRLFTRFLEQARKRYKKGEKKGAEMAAVSMEFQVFQENAKVRLDCAGAS